MAVEVEINSIETLPDGSLNVTVTMPQHEIDPFSGQETGEIVVAPLPIWIPLAALASRRGLYELATDDDALLAIVREHVKRESRLPEGDESADVRVCRAGGLRTDITITRDKALVSEEAMATLGIE